MTGSSFALSIALCMSGGPAQTRPAADAEVIVAPARITAVSAQQAVATLNVGSSAGAAPGDVVFVRLSGRVVVGELIAVGASESGARLADPAGVERDADAAVLRVGGLASLCRFLPYNVGIVGRVSRLAPGRTTAWTSLGRRCGLQAGDHVLIRRVTRIEGRQAGVPIARGQVLQLDDAASLVSLQPLVGNAVTETDDQVELWPAPGQARIGRVNSAVLAVRAQVEGAVLTVVGSAADGFTEGRLLDIHRGPRFIGVATVTESGPRPLSRARMIPSASLETAREADTAVLRAPAGPPDAPLVAPVFRIAGDYVLIAAGDVDGVRHGEKLRVQRQDPVTFEFRPVFEITIEKVNVDFSGGYARPLDAAAAPLREWELAERQSPPWPRWRAGGIVTGIDPGARVVRADVDPRSGVAPGDIIELAGEGEHRPGAAIVLWRMPDQVIAAVPHGWGDVEVLASAQVLVPQAGHSPLEAGSQAAP